MGGRSRGIALAGVGVATAGILLTVALQGGRSVPQLGGARSVIRAGPNTGGLPYSPGILVGNTLYLAGTIGEDAANNIVPGGIQAETRQALANIGEVLRTAGMSFQDVTSVTVYITSFDDFPDFNEVYRQVFPTDPPARATVQVAALINGARVELQMIAVRPHP
jgi:2-iminobutanoate/2-iminopropanoate deaminase